jgi:hypothetical protein
MPTINNDPIYATPAAPAPADDASFAVDNLGIVMVLPASVLTDDALLSAAGSLLRTDPDSQEEFAPIRIRLWPYLRTMAMLAWSAFRHPCTTTVIDSTTGRIISPDFEV